MYWTDAGDQYELLDGQQRTMSLLKFHENQFEVKRGGHSMNYRALPSDLKRKFLSHELLVFVCKGEPSERIKWFERINTAGEKLRQQEVRNCNSMQARGRPAHDTSSARWTTGCRRT